MNNYRRKNFNRKRGFNRRRQQEPFHQPLPPNLEVLPSSRHTLTKPDVEAVVDALLSGTLLGGNEIDRFESLFAKLTHSRHAIAFNATGSVFAAALGCLHLKEGDEVIASTLNDSNLASAVALCGAQLVLVDCDPETLTISPEEVRTAITKKTKVVVSNNFLGHPSDMSALREICDEHTLTLIDDARCGLGGKHRGYYIGNQADITCFSFAPDMAITSGEGGAITTDNNGFASWIRLFRENGIERDASKMSSAQPYWMELQFPGQFAKMSEMNAALGRSQLTRLDRHIDRRRTIADFYAQKLKENDDLILPYCAEWADHAYQAYSIQLTGRLYGKRDAVYKLLRERGIEPAVHVIPTHRMPYFASQQNVPSRFPNAESYFQNCISLPMFPDLSIKAMERITETLIEVLEQAREMDVENTATQEQTPRQTRNPRKQLEVEEEAQAQKPRPRKLRKRMK